MTGRIHSLLCPYFLKAFGWSVPIGGLAGLIGLGGGEFRLPVLLRVIGFGAKAAVPLNLVVSLVTLAFALGTRSRGAPLDATVAHLPEILGLALGGVVSAALGVRLVHRLSDARLVRLIAVLLLGLGLLLIVEAFLRTGPFALLPPDAWLRAMAGIALGLGIGIVSSMLGVAGGELLIPSLMLVFGADIRIAGTASLMISLLIVAMGVWRYGRMGALPLRGGARRIAVSMSLGSFLGAAAGGLAVAFAPVALLKLVLGATLLAAGLRSLCERTRPVG